MKAYDGDATKLAKPDQYFREVSFNKLGIRTEWFSQIMTIPRLDQRFEILVFRQRFNLQIAEIMPDLGIVRAAGVELRSSQRFKEVLQVVLTLGNTLNANSFRGNAGGFQLEGLLKVSQRVFISVMIIDIGSVEGN